MLGYGAGKTPKSVPIIVKYVHFLGEDHEIDVHKVDEPEFQSWKWISISELVGLAIDFKKPVYKVVVSEFNKIAQSLASGDNN